MTAYTLVSVVLPVRNAAAFVAGQVGALLGQGYAQPWELIVVDNDSTDQTSSVVWRALDRPWPPSLRRAEVLQFADRQGYASPRNFGAKASKGGLLAFCDADDRVSPEWLSELVAASSHPYLASTQVDPSDHEQAEGRSGAPSVPVKMGIRVAHAGGMACSRDLFERVGGFDPWFDLGGEDVDLAVRIRDIAGIEPVLVPAALYFVTPRPTRGAFRQGYRNGRSQVRLYARHRGVVSERAQPGRVAFLRVARLMRNAPYLLSTADRRRWAAVAGWTVGRTAWSMRLRVPYF